jgi:hypothetical protein
MLESWCFKPWYNHLWLYGCALFGPFVPAEILIKFNLRELRKAFFLVEEPTKVDCLSLHDQSLERNTSKVAPWKTKCLEEQSGLIDWDKRWWNAKKWSKGGKWVIKEVSGWSGFRNSDQSQGHALVIECGDIRRYSLRLKCAHKSPLHVK